MTVIETAALPRPDGTVVVRYSYVDERPDPVVRWTLAGFLLAVALWYLWLIASSGEPDPAWAAVVEAGARDLRVWFFGSLPDGTALVQPAPAAIWLMSLSVRLFGLSRWSILVPQALLGVATAAVLYLSLHRVLTQWRGAGATRPRSPRGAHWAALAGALALAVTPASALVFSSDHPTALVVFTLVLGTHFTLRATESSGRGWLALAGLSLGLGVLAGSLAALLVLPGLALAYLVGASGTAAGKLLDLAVGAGALLGAVGSFLAAVWLTPADQRPSLGGTPGSPLLQLLLPGAGSGGGAPGLGPSAWLLPAALVLGSAALVRLLRRDPLPVEVAATGPRLLTAGLVAGLGWLVVAGTVAWVAGADESYALAILAPASCGCAALGATVLWDDRRRLAAPDRWSGSATGFAPPASNRR